MVCCYSTETASERGDDDAQELAELLPPAEGVGDGSDDDSSDEALRHRPPRPAGGWRRAAPGDGSNSDEGDNSEEGAAFSGGGGAMMRPVTPPDAAARVYGAVAYESPVRAGRAPAASAHGAGVLSCRAS